MQSDSAYASGLISDDKRYKMYQREQIDVEILHFYEAQKAISSIQPSNWK